MGKRSVTPSGPRTVMTYLSQAFIADILGSQLAADRRGLEGGEKVLVVGAGCVAPGKHDSGRQQFIPRIVIKGRHRRLHVPGGFDRRVVVAEGDKAFPVFSSSHRHYGTPVGRPKAGRSISCGPCQTVGAPGAPLDRGRDL